MFGLVNVNNFLLASIPFFLKTNLLKNSLNLLQVYFISKRFYPGGGKPMGHAAKNVGKLSVEVPLTSSSVTPPCTALIVYKARPQVVVPYRPPHFNNAPVIPYPPTNVKSTSSSKQGYIGDGKASPHKQVIDQHKLQGIPQSSTIDKINKMSPSQIIDSPLSSKKSMIDKVINFTNETKTNCSTTDKNNYNNSSSIPQPNSNHCTVLVVYNSNKNKLNDTSVFYVDRDSVIHDKLPPLVTTQVNIIDEIPNLVNIVTVVEAPLNLIATTTSLGLTLTNQQIPVTVTVVDGITPICTPHTNNSSDTSLLMESVQEGFSADNDLTKTELESRGLIEKSNKANGVYIHTEEKGNVFIGEVENSYKFTKKGQGYLDCLPVKDKLIPDGIVSRLDKLEFNQIKIVVAVPSSDMYLSTSKLKHMLAVSDSNHEYYHLINPLTSTKKGMCFPISNQQFKQFQDEMQGKVLSEEDKAKPQNSKSQQLMKMHNIEIISKKDVLVVSDGNAYFNTLDDEVKKRIIKEFNIVKNADYKWFAINGVTKDECNYMIELHDYNESYKIKHPISLHDQEISAQAAQTQKDKQLANKDANNEKYNKDQEKYAEYKKK